MVQKTVTKDDVIYVVDENGNYIFDIIGEELIQLNKEGVFNANRES